MTLKYSMGHLVLLSINKNYFNKCNLEFFINCKYDSLTLTPKQQFLVPSLYMFKSRERGSILFL